MNKIYLLAPLVGMLVFGGIYTHYARQHAARLAETQRQEALAKTEKSAAAEAAKSKSLELARIAQTKRDEERAEKVRAEERQKQARLALEELRNQLIEETGRLRPKIAHLQRELADVVATVQRGEQQTRQLRQDERSSVENEEQAEASQNALNELLEQLERIERARSKSLRPAVNSKPQGS